MQEPLGWTWPLVKPIHKLQLSSGLNLADVVIHSCICMNHLHIKEVVCEQPRFENVIHLSNYVNINNDCRLEQSYLDYWTICECLKPEPPSVLVFT